MDNGCRMWNRNPQRYTYPISGTYEYTTLECKRTQGTPARVANRTKVDFKEIILDYSGGSSVIRVLNMKEGSRKVRRKCDNRRRGWSDWM